MRLDILFEDDELLVINKPPGLLMHASSIARDVDENLVDLLKEQLSYPIFTVHRLDRKTSGAVIIGKKSKVASALAEQFASRVIEKRYLAITRGYLLKEVFLDYSLKNENGNPQNAQTLFKPLKYAEIDIETAKYPTTRFTLVEAYPKTGRMHQIRRHLAHLRHYIVNDKPHGDCKLNNAFTRDLGYKTMMLHAERITFIHPISKEQLVIKAPLPKEFDYLERHLPWNSKL